MFTGIDEMLRSARDNFESMERDYQASLTRQEIPINMLNKVRALLAELRDPLDHIYKLIPGAANSNFPVSNSENHFLNYTRGISQNVIPILEEVQVFKDRTQWLKNFADRIEIGTGVFLLAGLSVILMALVTVSWQAIKAAMEDPVKSLRRE